MKDLKGIQSSRPSSHILSSVVLTSVHHKKDYPSLKKRTLTLLVIYKILGNSKFSLKFNFEVKGGRGSLAAYLSAELPYSATLNSV